MTLSEGTREGLRDWEGYVRSRFWNSSDPQTNNRSLRGYLADETDEVGMKVYVSYALSRWYRGLLPYLQQTRGGGEEGQRRHQGTTPLPQQQPLNGSFSHFVCLEAASDPLRHQRDVYDAMMDFLYPGADGDGGGRHAHPFPTKGAASLLPERVDADSDATTTAKTYDGPHATVRDPDQRNRLAHIVARLDRSVFKNRTALTDKLIGCPQAFP